MTRYRRDPSAMLPEAMTYDPRRPLEEQLLADFTATVKARGGVAFHIRDSRGQPAAVGLPDVIAPLGDTLFVVELKAPGQRATPEQLAALERFGVCTRVRAAVITSTGDRLRDLASVGTWVAGRR